LPICKQAVLWRSADILVCGLTGHSCLVSQNRGLLSNTGDWKVARTRRLESLRYFVLGYANTWRQAA